VTDFDTPQPTSMSSLARMLGVAPSTVSRALRGQPGVSPATRARILAMVGEVVPEPAGWAASRTSDAPIRRIAVAVPHLGSWYYGTALPEIGEVLHASGVEMVVHHIGGARDRHRFFDGQRRHPGYDALILVAVPVLDDLALDPSALGMPVICVGELAPGVASVSIDNDAAAHEATSYLIRLGHRRIGLIAATDEEGRLWSVATERRAGYRRALAEAGLPHAPELEESSDRGAAGGEEATVRLMTLTDPPTAILSLSDEEAIGSLRAAERLGLQVPDDLSVVGFDDQAIAQVSDLTTVRQPVREQARAAARLAVAHVLGGELPGEARLLPTQLVIRGTTAPPNAPGADQPATVS